MTGSQTGARTLRVTGLFAAAIGAALICGNPGYAIGGGAPAAEGSYRFVVQLDVGGVRGCSGALVDPQWILTATSCFAEDGRPPQLGPPPRPTTATVGRADLTGSSGHRLAVTKLIPRADRNVVLAKLASRISDISPVPIATAVPVTGDALRVAGYGRTATEWVPDRLHTAPFSVRAATDTTFDVAGVTAEAAICRGDAGGPAFRESGGRIELVGLNHISWQHGCLAVTETRAGATETRVDDLDSWIRESKIADAGHWQFLVAPNRDLVGVKMNNTGSGHTEAHVLSAASGYQQFTTHAGTPLEATNHQQWQYAIASNSDLVGIKMNNTGSGHTEIHILSAASGYQQFTTHAGTPLETTNPGQWQFLVAPNRDLVGIKMNNTGSGHTEIHVLSAASGYQQFTTHAGTPLETTNPGQWQFLVAPNRDLVGIKMNNTGSGHTEIHVLSAASGYQQFTTHAGTPLEMTNHQQWQYAIASNSDLVGIKMNDTGSGHTEIHVLSAASGYQQFTTHAATPLETTDPQY